MLHSFTPRETSVCSIHQHSRDKNVLDCFVRWEMSRCYIIPLRERRAYVPFINIRETSMCWITSLVETSASVAFFHSEREERVFYSSTYKRQSCAIFVEKWAFCWSTSENEHALWCFTCWHMSICGVPLHLERRACVLLIQIRVTSMWCGTLLFGRWACVASIHSLKDEYTLYRSTHLQNARDIAPPWTLDTCVLPLLLSFSKTMCVFTAFSFT